MCYPVQRESVLRLDFFQRAVLEFLRSAAGPRGWFSMRAEEPLHLAIARRFGASAGARRMLKQIVEDLVDEGSLRVDGDRFFLRDPHHAPRELPTALPMATQAVPTRTQQVRTPPPAPTPRRERDARNDVTPRNHVDAKSPPSHTLPPDSEKKISNSNAHAPHALARSYTGNQNHCSIVPGLDPVALLASLRDRTAGVVDGWAVGSARRSWCQAVDELSAQLGPDEVRRRFDALAECVAAGAHRAWWREDTITVPQLVGRVDVDGERNFAGLTLALGHAERWKRARSASPIAPRPDDALEKTRRHEREYVPPTKEEIDTLRAQAAAARATWVAPS